MPPRIDILESCLLPGTRWCRAVIQVDDDAVTVCGRCTDLLDLTAEEVVGSHLERVAESDEVVVEELASASQVVAEGPMRDPGDGLNLVDGPALFPHEDA